MPLKEIARFSVSHLQVLDEQGNLDPKLEPELSPDINYPEVAAGQAVHVHRPRRPA